MSSDETLEQALKRVYEADWRHRRDGGTCLYSQARIALDDLRVYCDVWVHAVRPEDVLSEDVQRVIANWYKAGRAPATITKRLNCLSKLGVNVEGHRPPKTRALKWWLRPEDRHRLCNHLKSKGVEIAVAYGGLGGKYGHKYASLADLIEWTTYTGLRIEESLRLTWEEVRILYGAMVGEAEITVPGTKTSSSQATLPIGEEPLRILLRRSQDTGRVFHDLDYPWIARAWDTVCKPFLGVENIPTATLKALRRSAARYLAVERGMPLPLVKDYLRHEDIQTTMSYLRLTGGSNTEDMRKWL